MGRRPAKLHEKPSGRCGARTRGTHERVRHEVRRVLICESAYRAAIAQGLGNTPGRSLLEFLYHPVPPAVASREVAEHFQIRMVSTDFRNRPGEKRFESIEIEAPGEMEIVQFTADGNKRFVLLLFLSRHFLKHHSKNRFNHIVALWVLVRKPVLEAVCSKGFAKVLDCFFSRQKGDWHCATAAKQSPDLHLCFWAGRIDNRMAQFVVKAPLHRLDQIAPGTRYRIQLGRRELLPIGRRRTECVNDQIPRLGVIESKPIRPWHSARELHSSKFVP